MKVVDRAVRTACIVAASWCVLGSTRVHADVMEQVPSDSLVVFKVNHLADTNKKVGDLLQSLGVSDLVPEMKDPMQSLQDKLGISAGLDSTKDAGAAILNGDLDAAGPPPFVLLLPVTDYKAFLGNMTLVRTEGDVSVVHFKDKEEDAFVEQWGSYAALSDKKENVSGKHEGIKTTGQSAKQLAEKDACIYVNFPALKTQLLPKLDEGEKSMGEQIDKNVDAAHQKLAHVAGKQLINAAREFLNDAQGTTVGISVSKEGIGSSMVMEFTPDSYIGKMMAQMKNSDQPVLTGLPKANYIAYGGCVEDGKLMLQMVNDGIGPVLNELATVDDDGKKLSGMISDAIKPLASVEGGSFGVVAPTAALGQGSMVRFLGVYKGDAEALKANVAKSSDFMGVIMKMAGAQQQAGLLKTTFTPDAKTVNGVKFDSMKMEVNPDNTSQEAMRMSEAFNQIYGPEGVNELFGAVDAKTLVAAFGIDDDLLGQTVDAAKANTDILTADLASVDSGLPKNRAAVFYFGLGQLGSTVLSYAKANGLPMNVQLPANLPPIGFSMGTDGPTVRGDCFVPMRLMQSVMQAGLQVYQQMNQRGGGGGGGGL